MGEQGFAKINVTHDVHPYDGGPWPQGHGIGYADSFVIEAANFLKAITTNKEFHPNFEDGLKCREILEAAEKSVLEGRWVTIESL